ncbi:MAG TPA: M14 family metallopeptidase [Polyangiales bacterium]|nr:M14 family metallopeptidase [Polyangiales bacterium]
MLDRLFCADYHADRTAFVSAVQAFAVRSGRRLQLQSHSVDEADDLTVTAALLEAERPRRVFVLSIGIHGVEGYAGSAIARHLLAGLLDRIDQRDTGILLVHALNPYGFANFVRVNANNIDLNRNVEALGEALFATDSHAYSALTPLLAPQRRRGPEGIERARYQSQLVAALVRHGRGKLRQASLAGQFIDPRGIFYGGQRVEPEIGFFQRLYESLSSEYEEVLLTDLHTGYGAWGEAYPLFGRADSIGLRALIDGGVTDASGQDKTYTVYGDLVGYCFKTAKRLRPQGVFNGLVIELGTHGLSMLDQARDLYTVVSENQARQHGVSDERAAAAAREKFREMFYPSDRAWRDRAVRVGALAVERVLASREYLSPLSGS